MSSLYMRKTIAQATANADTELVIPTELTVDGRQGWDIIGVRWSVPTWNVGIDPTKDCSLQIQLNTETGSQTFVDPDSIVNFHLQTSGITASTSAFEVNSYGISELVAPRTTVQPNLYLHVLSTNLLAPMSVNVEIVYDIVKLTDIEVMRLLQGGA